MNGSENPPTGKLDADDLELLIGAIEGLSAKISAIERNAPVFSKEQVARISYEFAAKGQNRTLEKLDPILEQIQNAIDQLDKETNQSKIRERQRGLSDIDKIVRDNRWWRFGTVGTLVAILIGSWFAHGFIVRTVGGCHSLSGEFYHAKLESGDPSFCFFDR